MEIIKNLNRRSGKFFYVAFRGDEWIAKIYWGMCKSYEIFFEDNVFKSEKSEIIEFCDKLNQGD